MSGAGGPVGGSGAAQGAGRPGSDSGGSPGGSAGLPLLARARSHADRVAVVDADGEHAYGALLRASRAMAGSLLEAAGMTGPGGDGAAASPEPSAAVTGPAGDLEGERVAFLAPPGLAWVATLWGIWRAGGIAVPLCASHPPRELAYVLDDAGAGLVAAHPSFRERLAPLAEERGLPLLGAEAGSGSAGRGAGHAGPGAAGPGAAGEGSDDPPDGPAPPAAAAEPQDPSRGALILYTSGTTGRPKGALHTHASLAAQMESLVRAWAWSPEDRILHVLPLHHTHGIVNALLCALWSGAACEMLPGFDAAAVWDRFAAGAEGRLPPVTLFMAVPTVYVKLIAAWEEAPGERRRAWSAGARSLRLTVSGSAALPERTFRRWREVAGHDLLERYGMTEIGMALSNPLEGERRPGTVGRPLPGVRLRLVDDEEETLAADEGAPLEAGSGAEGTEDEERAARRGPPGPPPPDAGPGEIRVRGPGVFREYWRRPEATAEGFRDGWFRTGDVASIEDGYWRILGRSSVDILKSGGYKLSALEIEEVLRAHPGVGDCAVVGLPDPEWGERVAAAVVPAGSGSPGRGGEAEGCEAPSEAAPEELPARLEAWARDRLAPYKVPRRWLVVEELPRNALGKVTKPEVKRLFETAPEGGD